MIRLTNAHQDPNGNGKWKNLLKSVLILSTILISGYFNSVIVDANSFVMVGLAWCIVFFSTSFRNSDDYGSWRIFFGIAMRNFMREGSYILSIGASLVPAFKEILVPFLEENPEVVVSDLDNP